MDSQDNRRYFSRVKFDSEVTLHFGGKAVKGILKDISLKGALVQLSSGMSVEKGDSCLFEFNLESTSIILNINAVLVYYMGSDLGLRFDKIDLESMTHLRRLIEYNAVDPDEIQKELFFLSSD